jgi:hypothetical protein
MQSRSERILSKIRRAIDLTFPCISCFLRGFYDSFLLVVDALSRANTYDPILNSSSPGEGCCFHLPSCDVIDSCYDCIWNLFDHNELVSDNHTTCFEEEEVNRSIGISGWRQS